MNPTCIRPQPRRTSVALLCAVFFSCVSCGALQAQIRQVRVGVTPFCTNGYPVCWPAAAEGLSLLPGVLAAEDAIVPNFSTCTAIIAMRGNRLPDLPEWHRRFHDVAGDQQRLRGVEITIIGNVAVNSGRLLLRASGLSEPIPLEPLGATTLKLDYDFKSKKSAPFSTAERRKYAELTAAVQRAPGNELAVTVVGLLGFAAERPYLEVAYFGDRESAREQGGH